jgi:hypothetical protein
MDFNKIEENTNIWIYLMDCSMFNEYKNYIKKTNLCYIAIYDKILVQKNDIIFLCTNNDKRNNGIRGILQIRSEFVINDNNKIKIFNDKTFNRCIAKLEYAEIYNQNIKFKNIFSYLEKNIENFKSRTFKNEYIKKLNSAIKLSKNIRNCLIDYFEKMSDPNLDTESLDDLINDLIDDKPEKESLNIKKLIENISESNSETEEIGSIPIIFDPCKNYIVPDYNGLDTDIDQDGNTDEINNKIKYFIQHSKKCKKCRITNNNNFDLYQTFSNSIFNYEIINSKSTDYISLMNDYDTSTICNPIGDIIDKNIIKLYEIDCQNSLYNNCIIIVCIFN